MPLASPRRRLAALLIDLAVIGLLTVLTRNFALALGAVIGLLFIRVAFTRTPVKGSVFGRAMRLSVGCLGLVIGGTTAVIWAALSFDLAPDDSPVVRVTTPGDTLEMDASLARMGLTNLLAGAGGLGALSQADSRSDAAEAVGMLVDVGTAADLDADQIRSTIEGLVEDDHRWSEELPALLDQALLDRGFDVEIREPSIAPGDSARLAALDAVAGDTLRRLAERIEGLSGDLRDSRERLTSTQESLDEATGGGVFATLRGFVDELGFGFGWASLYLTVMLSWWKGQTIGKRVMGVRVVRLDGEPITWWIAFERAGGYAAGFATGLLGFAQVYWDANRQAIHDRIVGTVVVMDGAEKVGNWEEAL